MTNGEGVGTIVVLLAGLIYVAFKTNPIRVEREAMQDFEKAILAQYAQTREALTKGVDQYGYALETEFGSQRSPEDQGRKARLDLRTLALDAALRIHVGGNAKQLIDDAKEIATYLEGEA